MTLVDFLKTRGISQNALYMAMDRVGLHLFQPDISRMIRGKMPIYPKARQAFRAALIELHCDPIAVGSIVELTEDEG